jgi:hypothetical protein
VRDVLRRLLGLERKLRLEFGDLCVDVQVSKLQKLKEHQELLRPRLTKPISTPTTTAAAMAPNWIERLLKKSFRSFEAVKGISFSASLR